MILPFSAIVRPVDSLFTNGLMTHSYFFWIPVKESKWRDFLSSLIFPFVVLSCGEASVPSKQSRGCRRSRAVTFTAIRLRGPGLKSRPGQKFENKNFCFRRTPAVVKACHPCRVRLVKTPLYKT